MRPSSWELTRPVNATLGELAPSATLAAVRNTVIAKVANSIAGKVFFSMAASFDDAKLSGRFGANWPLLTLPSRWGQGCSGAVAALDGAAQ